MGKILIFNCGPNSYEQGGNYPCADAALLKLPAATWAEAVAGNISAEKPCAVYYCPLPGARETAELVAGKLGLTAIPLKGLEKVIDRNWKGMAPADYLKMECSFEENPPGPDDLKLPFTGGIDDLRNALGAALDEVAKQHKKEAILIVSHCMLTVLMALHLLHLHNKHYRQIEQDFGSLNLFEVRFGMPSAIYINDTCHLHGLI